MTKTSDSGGRYRSRAITPDDRLPWWRKFRYHRSYVAPDTVATIGLAGVFGFYDGLANMLLGISGTSTHIAGLAMATGGTMAHALFAKPPSVQHTRAPRGRLVAWHAKRKCVKVKRDRDDILAIAIFGYDSAGRVFRRITEYVAGGNEPIYGYESTIDRQTKGAALLWRSFDTRQDKDKHNDTGFQIIRCNANTFVVIQMRISRTSASVAGRELMALIRYLQRKY